jgi:outer membrane receptor protein involved in Fe transport
MQRESLRAMCAIPKNAEPSGQTAPASRLASRRRSAPFRRSLVAAALAGLAAPVMAQNAMLEEVVVTAQKRTESLQDVPISVSAVSGDKMVEMNITNLESLTTYVPNFSMNQSGISNNITIRGVSSGINPGFEQSTGMYVDNIYYGRGQLSRAPMFDLERVEVLRGPQPILFGKNSIAGAVSMMTARPTQEFEGSITALYESEEARQDYRLVLSGPITDTLSGRLSVLYREMDGNYTNTFTGGDEKEEEEQVFRGSLLWQPTDELSVRVKYESNTSTTTAATWRSTRASSARTSWVRGRASTTSRRWTTSSPWVTTWSASNRRSTTAVSTASSTACAAATATFTTTNPTCSY